MNRRRTNTILAIAIILAVLPVCTQAIPMPHGIAGTVYMSDGVTQVPWGTSFSVNDTTSGDYIAGTTGAGPHSGAYSVVIDGEDGDTVIVAAWTATHYGTTTVTLSGDVTGIDVIINTSFADTTPPASITNLQNTTGTTWINWTWTNPTDTDFNHTMVYLNGTWQTNTSNPFYNATGLCPNVSYEIGTHTVDTSGNVNTTWINQTTKTATQKGDLNHDGNVSSADVQIALDIAFSGGWDPEADIDENGYVNVLDARMIMLAAAGRIDL